LNKELLIFLKQNIGIPLTWQTASDIYVKATKVVELVPQAVIDKILPEQIGEYTFARERLELILAEMKPLHQAHWDEKEVEEGRPGFKPNYEKFILFEQAGRALVFTLRRDGNLIGNFSLYLSESMHTQALRSTEDTLYIIPEERKGRLAARLVGYAERALKQLGVTEINVTVKIDNKHGRYFQMIGYNHVSNGLMKVLED
jgi:N-acetylglutamate synthase-like GNAT family acetyltransferase